MLKLLLFLPILLSANTNISSYKNPHQDSLEWLTAVEDALYSPDYCIKLKPLITSPNADQDVNVILKQILEKKCKDK